MKKPVKTAKKAPARRAKATVPAHRTWKVLWIRNVINDEFIAYAKQTPKGILMMEATIVTTFQDQMILAPYGTMTKDKAILLKNDHVVHANEVTDIMRTFYETSVSTSWDFVQESFNQVITRSTESVIRISESDEAPSADGVVVAKKDQGEDRDLAKTIDELVKLAEAAGKGRKV